MEVGAVKQAFNNEVILLKKNLNQAKIQVIHKLTRKAKTLTQRKVPEPLEQKLKRKAESAVNEVLAIKKIKPKDLAKFIVTHTKELKQYLNNPKADQEKACARLLLHKSLQEKYKFIRGRFSNVPIEDLLMSRLERRKLKKEAREKKKKKGKDSKVVNSEGDWEVEDVEMGDDSVQSNNTGESDDEVSSNNEEQIASEDRSNVESDDDNNDDSDGVKKYMTDNDADSETDDNSKNASDVSKKFQLDNVNKQNGNKKVEINEDVVIPSRMPEKIVKNNLVKKDKPKDNKKNKNLNDKLKSRKFKKDAGDSQVSETKIVDPFFITSTGENYMSVAEPRQPDEVKEIHKQGNRKLRRAVMFGHVPKIKPRKDNFDPNKNFNRENSFDKGNRFNNKFHRQFEEGNDRNNFTDRKFNNNEKRSNLNDRNSQFNRKQDEKPDKLHPSWEAKKKQSGILPFQGKKIVFDS